MNGGAAAETQIRSQGEALSKLDHSPASAGFFFGAIQMSRPKKAEGGQLTVKRAEAIHDGKGGFLPVGAKFDAADKDAAEALKARGLAE